VRHEGEGGRDDVVIETFLVCWRSTGGCNATRPKKGAWVEGVCLPRMLFEVTDWSCPALVECVWE